MRTIKHKFMQWHPRFGVRFIFCITFVLAIIANEARLRIGERKRQFYGTGMGYSYDMVDSVPDFPVVAWDSVVEALEGRSYVESSPAKWPGVDRAVTIIGKAVVFDRARCYDVELPALKTRLLLRVRIVEHESSGTYISIQGWVPYDYFGDRRKEAYKVVRSIANKAEKILDDRIAKAAMIQAQSKRPWPIGADHHRVQERVMHGDFLRHRERDW